MPDSSPPNNEARMKAALALSSDALNVLESLAADLAAQGHFFIAAESDTIAAHLRADSETLRRRVAPGLVGATERWCDRMARSAVSSIVQHAIAMQDLHDHAGPEGWPDIPVTVARIAAMLRSVPDELMHGADVKPGCIEALGEELAPLGASDELALRADGTLLTVQSWGPADWHASVGGVSIGQGRTPAAAAAAGIERLRRLTDSRH